MSRAAQRRRPTTAALPPANASRDWVVGDGEDISIDRLLVLHVGAGEVWARSLAGGKHSFGQNDPEMLEDTVFEIGDEWVRVGDNLVRCNVPPLTEARRQELDREFTWWMAYIGQGNLTALQRLLLTANMPEMRWA